MRTGRVAIVHYMPLEMYPPVMNLINTLSSFAGAQPISIYSTESFSKQSIFKGASAGTRIYRFGSSDPKRNWLARLWSYLCFYLGTTWMLIKNRPDKVLYFDSISSFPAVIYKRLFPKVQLFIHYHEYMSKEEYAHGMLLLRKFHMLEKKIYGRVTWLSHTNKERMSAFLDDLGGWQVPNQYILPNYPPASWAKKALKEIQWPLRIVYTGALSLDTMHTVAFGQWVIAQNGRVTWDVYSNNITTEAVQYLHSLPGALVRLYDAVDYYDLPSVLDKYDVGVILYNGHIPNYVFNAPNKLFEYASCGLDVWFPRHMKSSIQYQTDKTFPKIVAVDFLHPEQINLDEITNRHGLQFRPHSFNCETALLPILERLA
jgi:hypothetical protein